MWENSLFYCLLTFLIPLSIFLTHYLYKSPNSPSPQLPSCFLSPPFRPVFTRFLLFSVRFPPFFIFSRKKFPFSLVVNHVVRTFALAFREGAFMKLFFDRLRTQEETAARFPRVLWHVRCRVSSWMRLAKSFLDT